MIDYKKEALEIKDEIIANRRHIHANPELGLDMPMTVDFIMEKLRSYGYDPQPCGKGGVVAMAGQGGKVMLLRGDTDALPMYEESGLPFASKVEACHSCGHDMHAAMLLGAARLLKAHESELKGRVKFMFQPGEEILGGAAEMIAHGLMENPKVDVAMGMHTSSGHPRGDEVGKVYYYDGYSTFSGDYVRIDVVGKQAHGASTYRGVDAINIAAHIVVALQDIIAREIPNLEPGVVLVGKIYGGSSCNTMSGECSLDVSVRAANAEMRAFLKQRVHEIAEGTAKTFRGEAIVTDVYGMPPMYNHPDMVGCIPDYLKEILGEENIVEVKERGGTEDFTAVAELVPSIYVNLGSGHLAGEGITHHNPKIIFDEDALPLGAAVYAHAATRYLEEHT